MSLWSHSVLSQFPKFAAIYAHMHVHTHTHTHTNIYTHAHTHTVNTHFIVASTSYAMPAVIPTLFKAPSSLLCKWHFW